MEGPLAHAPSTSPTSNAKQLYRYSNGDNPPARPSSEIQPIPPVTGISDDSICPPARLSRRPSSLFIEDLPEYKPYHLLTPLRRSHRKSRSLGSPTLSISLSLRRRKRKLSDESKGRKGTGVLRHNSLDLHSPKRRKARRSFRSRMKRNVWWCWRNDSVLQDLQPTNAPSGEIGPAVENGSNATKAEVGKEAGEAERPLSITAEMQPASEPALLQRRHSTLKKRPPKHCPASLRSSSYSEWRSSMIIVVSADVSRRSSMKSKTGRRHRARRSILGRRTPPSGGARGENSMLSSKQGRIAVLARVIVTSLRKWCRRGARG